MPLQSTRVSATCQHCGSPFEISRADYLRRTNKHCSRACRRATNDPVKRFWSRVLKTDACWLWTGPTYGIGYGQFSLTRTKNVGAHRYSWELANGPIPAGMLVLHRCDVPACVNPDHLFLGTEQDNSNDMRDKGRACFGNKNASSKLTPENVRHIRAAYRFRGPVKALAKKYGVSVSTINRIARGKLWPRV